MAVARALSLGRLRVPQTVGAVFITKKNSGTLAFLKDRRGRGGRSSFSGVVATVFGATGFIGHYVVNSLGKMGSQVIIPYRGDPYDVEHMRLAGDLGQILFTPWHLRDEESIRKAIQYSNVVVNLVGTDHETRNFNMTDVNVDGARRIARIAKDVGVEKFIHFSSLNANAKPQVIFDENGPEFLRTKYAGELAVEEEFPEAVIIRPSDIIGEEDRFIRLFIDRKRRTRANGLFLWKKGEQTVKRPVVVHDVVKGTINAIFDQDAKGKTYELYGPRAYYLADLVDYMCGLMYMNDWKRRDLDIQFRLRAMLVKYFPSRLKFDLSRLEKEAITDRPTDLPTLEDLGVKPSNIEDMIFYVVRERKKSGYFMDYKKEMTPVSKPQFVQGEY